MSTTSAGRQAETAAANYLLQNGFTILSRNWHTRWCEIDIVAQKKETVYFVEVKYRRTNNWGGGVDYITPKKLQQMQFAAEIWVSSHKWHGDYLLSAIEISGAQFAVGDWVEDASR